MRTTNYTELRNNLKGYFDKVVEDCEPLIVQRPNKESVVIIPMEEYNAMKETEYIMRSPKMLDIIKKGEKEIEKGTGQPINLDDLWK
ncbi:MAG: type II toxin-antitoxin system Phd/YefM family antitoxin [Prevotella sp.]|nr:type II toxin-antitoxin system Phd/YefM family antitoxin [Prevotella sp.]